MKRVLALLVSVCLLALALAGCGADMRAEVEGLPAAEVQAATQTVRYIAHRGLVGEVINGTSVTHGENTIEAFRSAARTPTVWGIETDVWQTKDGVLVCMHDKDAVEGIKDVHQADSASVLSAPLKKAAGYYAPTFEAYLEACRLGGKTAVVELKDPDMTPACLDDVMSAIRTSGVDAVVISFYCDKLFYVREQWPEAQCMLLYNRNWQRYYRRSCGSSIDQEGLLSLAIRNRWGLSVDCQYLYDPRDEGWTARFHEAGLTVGVWTVDDVYTAIYAATALGADYVTTNVDMGTLVAKATA